MRCHSLVSIFTRSWRKSCDLREKQQLLGIPQHKLKQDVSTRWGSTYEMIVRIIEQQQAISAVLAENRKCWNCMPSDEELLVMETVKDVLGNVFYLTDALAGEQEVTASLICCILSHLQTKLGVKEGDSMLAISMKETMLTDLNKRYNLPDVSRVLEICSFLDPRFKTQYLEVKETTLQLVKEECLTVRISSGLDNHSQDEPGPSTSNDLTTPPCKKKKGLSAILRHIEEENMQNLPTVTPEDKVNNEISAYLDYPIMNSETNPLVWWKAEQRRFPTLSILAKKYLCICGTSVPSERIFSTGGYIVSNYRSRLLPKNVNY